ncbi:HesA/MoeB/ThiF family protein [Ruminococcus flavefaciens]|uniref:Thiazole biosynthesis adenylyltransferase ThiF, E. coli subfamily n=1 Tax=Ruminococcus flavefaciens TaxID=1265 RepID=A0A1M7LN09_RUMFL|nr:molybdopterin-synthase adenylyltransferase MoeB [Ruminococcus flavefaciens]SHM79540.1 thiazole biosynthesis adenylyltransferase ThiF, E. coli subfamily [Ruminococcus flavefaciens]
MALTDEQLERYSRHITLKEIGVRGQKKLLAAKVLIIGAGGLGAPTAMYLAAAGVGTIGIADCDNVELSNLQRQIIHTTNDVGKSKVQSAAEAIKALNPDVTVKNYHEYVNSKNIANMIADYDFIIDGADNFPTKFLINDACVLGHKPFCHAGILRFEGQLMTYVPDKSPCYRCIFEAPPPKDAVPSCREAGVIGAMAGIIGSMQALEAVKYITGQGELLTGSMLIFDGLKMEWRKIKLPKRVPTCPICGDNPTITEVFDEEQQTCSLG